LCPLQEKRGTHQKGKLCGGISKQVTPTGDGRSGGLWSSTATALVRRTPSTPGAATQLPIATIRARRRARQLIQQIGDILR
jgi:hypothetical protein